MLVRLMYASRATAAVDPPASTIPERIETSIEAGESAVAGLLALVRRARR